MTRLKVFASKINRALMVVLYNSAGIAAATVFVIMVLITVDVVLRYVFNSPIQGSYQLAEFMMVGVVYLSIAYVQSLRGHIKIEVATTWLPPKCQVALDIFGHLVGIAIFAIITWQSGKIAWHSWSISDYTMGVVEFPLWPAKSLVPIGTGLLCLRLIFDAIHDIAALCSLNIQMPGEREEMH